MKQHDLDALIARTTQVVRDEALPLDDEHDGDIEAAGGESARATLQAGARAAGVFAPHAPVDCGGLGLGMVERVPVFEEAGYSLFGPLALNIAAPDEGNIHLLDQVATPGQRERYLQPLAHGRVRSAFAMTEPAPGAGADPSMLATSATKVDGGWLVNGRKWFITGADGASFFITMARTSGAPGSPGGATMFLMPTATDGVDVVRHVGTVDRSMIGGHCEVGVRRCVRARRRGARGSRRGIPLRTGPARPGPHDPRHALDRRRPPGARAGGRPTSPPVRRSGRDSPTLA